MNRSDANGKSCCKYTKKNGIRRQRIFFQKKLQKKTIHAH